MKHSAEWYRGAVAVLGRMVDECDKVFTSDLPHITEGNLEDYLAEYSQQLAEAEAREAGGTGLAEQLAAAKAEVVKLAELVKEYLDPEEWKHENRAGWILCSGCGSQLDIGRYHAPDCKWVTRVKQAESPALAWLAARDARMKRLGAAEWLEAAAREGGYYERSSEGMREEAAQLRQQAEAARLEGE